MVQGVRANRHRRLPSPQPTPYTKNFHLIFTLCMDPTGQRGLESGPPPLDLSPGQLRRCQGAAKQRVGIPMGTRTLKRR